MIETSRDILNIVIASAVGLLTLFFCWMLWYVISTMRNINRMTLSARKKLETIDKILELVKEKLEKGSNHMAILSDSAIKLVGYFLEKQGNKSGSKKSKKKK
jgi:hypothetical protein